MINSSRREENTKKIHIATLCLVESQDSRKKKTQRCKDFLSITLVVLGKAQRSYKRNVFTAGCDLWAVSRQVPGMHARRQGV